MPHCKLVAATYDVVRWRWDLYKQDGVRVLSLVATSLFNHVAAT